MLYWVKCSFLVWLIRKQISKLPVLRSSWPIRLLQEEQERNRSRSKYSNTFQYVFGCRFHQCEIFRNLFGKSLAQKRWSGLLRHSFYLWGISKPKYWLRWIQERVHICRSRHFLKMVIDNLVKIDWSEIMRWAIFQKCLWLLIYFPSKLANRKIERQLCNKSIAFIFQEEMRLYKQLE